MARAGLLKGRVSKRPQHDLTKAREDERWDKMIVDDDEREAYSTFEDFVRGVIEDGEMTIRYYGSKGSANRRRGQGGSIGSLGLFYKDSRIRHFVDLRVDARRSRRRNLLKVAAVESISNVFLVVGFVDAAVDAAVEL